MDPREIKQVLAEVEKAAELFQHAKEMLARGYTLNRLENKVTFQDRLSRAMAKANAMHRELCSTNGEYVR